jgi:geranylgeranyl reductase family protein
VSKYDVVVCGAGPAGATAARLLAKAGHRILLLDKDKFPRDKTCGGALRPQVFKEIDNLEDALKKIPHVVCKKTVMHSPSLTYNATWRPKDSPVMYSIHRKDFDNYLLNLAIDSGAEFREDNRVKGVRIDNNQAIVELDDGKTISSGLVIGACGVNGPIGKYLRRKEGLPEKWPSSQIGLVLAKEYHVGEDFVDNAYGMERTHHFHLKPKNIYGYGWTFPKIDALNIGFGAFWNDMKKIDKRITFNGYLNLLKRDGLFPKNVEMGNIRGAILPLRGPINMTYTDRILLVGDTAGFVSPISGDGIYYAMKSARFAVDTAIKALSNNDFNKSALESYQRTWQASWKKEFSTLCYFADRLSANPERLIRYASIDPYLRESFAGIINGTVDPVTVKSRIIKRIKRDLIIYDILRRKS